MRRAMAIRIVAEHLTMTPDDIHVTCSDTGHGLDGTGPGGSRYTVMIAGAIAGASTKIKRKLMRHDAERGLERQGDDDVAYSGNRPCSASRLCRRSR